MKTIVHLSDLHFARGSNAGLDPADALTLASAALRSRYEETPLVVVISGDVTTQGKAHGYAEALSALRKQFLPPLRVEKILLCPGNHDILNGDRTFAAFNRFAFDLTADATQAWDSQSPVSVITWVGVTYVLVNSSFHGDYRDGQVPLEALRKALDGAPDAVTIVVMHHSPISSTYSGGGLAGAFEFLDLVTRYNVAAVLHGHVHSDQVLTFGTKPTLLHGTGSIGFDPDPNMNNQFGVLSFTDDGKLVEGVTYKFFRNRNEFVPATTRGLP